MDASGTPLTLDAAVAKAKDVADRVLAPSAAANDKAGRFSEDAVDALGTVGLLGLTMPVEHGGSGLGPRAFAAVGAALAEADASVAIVYIMHVCAAATILAARPAASVADTLGDIAAGRHLSTLAFSETGSRSHFWGPSPRRAATGRASI
jgi:alkylation response protein AidB-like acyl-CoA dehydrogenase